ncbi:MAG: hypothetical protein QW334_00095 [Thermofilum sp.]
MSQTPGIGRNAVIMKDSTPIGYTEDYECSAEADVIKAYGGSDTSPALLEYGDMTFNITINKIVVEQEFWNAFLNKTKVVIKIHPYGTGSGKLKIEFSDCVIKSVGAAFPRSEVITEKVTIEARGMTVGLQT